MKSPKPNQTLIQVFMEEIRGASATRKFNNNGGETMTLKELADLGAAAAFEDNKYHHYMSVSKRAHSWDDEEPARQAFAAAVKEAVLAELVTKSDSSPTTKTVPLDYTDIRATDEFRCKELHIIETAQFWHGDAVELSYGLPQRYADLADNYLRRQHGSNEWKPCTKEVSV